MCCHVVASLHSVTPPQKVRILLTKNENCPLFAGTYIIDKRNKYTLKLYQYIFVLLKYFLFHLQFLTVALSTTDGAPAPQRIGAFDFAGVGFNRETGKG